MPVVTRRTVLRGLGAIAAVAAMPVAPASAAARKWHPGHYFCPPHTRWSADNQAAHFRALDAVGPHVRGIKVGFNWGYLEGARGDYSPGFRIIDAYLDRLPPGKYLMLQVNERSFGDLAAGVHPRYVVDNGWVVTRRAGQTWRGNLATTAKMWQPAVMDRLIALSHAFAARYDAHPRFEQFSLGETALGVPGLPTEAWRTQLTRWFTESKKVWPATYLRLNANFINNDAAMRSLITSCVAGGGVTVGGPDPELPRPSITRFITANRVFRGDDGGADLRGTVPWTGEVRALGTRTPREIFDYFHDIMRASHMIWPHDSAGVLPYVNSIQGRIRMTIGA